MGKITKIYDNVACTGEGTTISGGYLDASLCNGSPSAGGTVIPSMTLGWGDAIDAKWDRGNVSPFVEIAYYKTSDGKIGSVVFDLSNVFFSRATQTVSSTVYWRGTTFFDITASAAGATAFANGNDTGYDAVSKPRTAAGSSVLHIRMRVTVTEGLTNPVTRVSGFIDIPISLSVGAPSLESISIVGEPPVQYVGNVPSIGDASVIGHFVSKDENVSYYEDNAITSYTLLAQDAKYNTEKWKRGDNTLNVSYVYSGTNHRASKAVTVVYLHHIEAENTKRSFYVNEAFSYGEGFAVKAVYSDGTYVDVTEDCLIDNEYEGRTFVETGAHSYSISYQSTVTGELASLTIDYAVVYDDVQSISISGSHKTLFLYGESFDTEGLIVTATMKSGQTAVLDPGEYSISTEVGAVLLQTTSRTITVSYGGKSASYSIVMRYLDSISVSGYEDEFFQNDYFARGDNFRVDATYAYSDGRSPLTVEGIGGYTLSHSESVRLTETPSTVITVSFTDGGLTRSTNYSVDVIPIEVESIVVDASGLDSDTQGEKLFYEGYTEFYPNAALSVTAHYNNGTTASVSLTNCSFQPSVGSTFTGTGTKTVTVSYGGKSDTYSVTVAAHAIDHISVDATNASRDFVVGGKFDYNGLKVKAVYNSGYETLITDGIGGYTISPLKNYSFAEEDYGAQFPVTVTYSGFTDSYSVSVDYPPLSSIVIDTSQVNLTPKNGDVWDPSLVSVTAKYAVGGGAYLEKALDFASVIGAGKFAVDASPLQLGQDNTIGVTDFRDYTIGVTAKSHFDDSTQTGSFSVSVLPNKQLLEIYLDASEAKTEYKTGERFTGEGFCIMAKFLDVEGYTKIAVDPNNASLQTANPYLGAVIYKAGRYEVTFSYTYLGVTKSTTAYITVIPSYQTEVYKTETLKVVRLDSLSHEEAEIRDFNSDGKIWALFDANDTAIDDDPTSTTYGERKLKATVSSPKCYGYIRQGTESEGVTTQAATVVLFDDYLPPNDGESNVSVTFPRYAEGAADKINKCTFGALFGNRNSRNRLFVAGNPDLPNIDWHSEAVNAYQLDENQAEMANYMLTYFPDTSYQQYGLSSNAIVGYSILSTGDLFVIKGPSKQEPTFYARSAGTSQAITGAGSTQQGIDGSTLRMETYTISTGNVDEGGVSPSSVATFNNESLFLTENGIKAVSPSTSISAIKLNPRSTRVDRAIKKESLAQCFAATTGDALYLFTGSKAYAAYKGCVGNDGEYEWFVLEGVPANCAATIGSALWFGTTDGRLCAFDDSEPKGKRYQDDSRTYVGVGGVLPISADDSSDRIIVSRTYADRIREGDRIDVLFSDYGGAIYARLGEFATQSRIDNLGLDTSNLEGVIDPEAGVFRISADGDLHEIEPGTFVTHEEYVKDAFHDGRVVYIDEFVSPVMGADNATGRPYVIETMDPETGEDYGDGCFKLVRDDGTYADLGSLEACRISFRPEFGIVSDLEDDGTSLSFSVIAEHDHAIDVIRYANQPMDGFSAVITHAENVACSYATKPFDLGSVGFKKNVLSWTLVNDSDYRSEMDLGYRADNKRPVQPIKGFETGSGAFDATDFSFRKASTLADALPHVYTRWKTLPNVDFLSFVAGNSSASNCVLTNITIIYTGGNPRKGED